MLCTSSTPWSTSECTSFTCQQCRSAPLKAQTHLAETWESWWQLTIGAWGAAPVRRLIWSGWTKKSKEPLRHIFLYIPWILNQVRSWAAVNWPDPSVQRTGRFSCQSPVLAAGGSNPVDSIQFWRVTHHPRFLVASLIIRGITNTQTQESNLI